MTVLRELVALFRIDYDRSGARAAERDLDRLTGRARRTGRALGHPRVALGRFTRSAGAANVATTGLTASSLGLGRTLGSLGIALGAYEAVRGLGSMIQMASDANETTNLLGITFEGMAGDVEKWSAHASERWGRSLHEMQESAAQFGALMKASFGPDGIGDVVDMSERLSERVIDVSSAVNVDEDEMRRKMLSGLRGEAEPLSSLGVDVRAQGIANVLGLDKNWQKNATLAEQYAIRFQAIMKQTEGYRDDAVKTSEEQAGAQRALADATKDVVIEMGSRLLPAITWVTRAARDWVRSMRDVVKEAGHLEAAAVTLGIGITAAFAPVIATVALVAAAFFALFLIVDDITIGMMDGKSVIGEFLDDLLGIEDVLPKWREFWEEVGEDLHRYLNETDAFIGDLKGAWSDFVAWMKEIFSDLYDNTIGKLTGAFSNMRIEGPGFGDQSLPKMLGFSEDANGNLTTPNPLANGGGAAPAMAGGSPLAYPALAGGPSAAGGGNVTNVVVHQGPSYFTPFRDGRHPDRAVNDIRKALDEQARNIAASVAKGTDR